MSKRNKNKGVTMSNENQETVEQSQIENSAEVGTPIEVSTPEIVQEAVVETPIEEKRSNAEKKVTIEVATKTTARIAQKPATKNNLSYLQSDNPRVRQLAFQINQYMVLCNQTGQSESDLTKRLTQFTHIIRVIINSTDTEVYSAAYQFFKNHRKDILSETSVFQYVHSLPTELSIRVQTIYTVFMELVASNVDKRPFRLDYGLIRDNMKLPAQHPLMNWIRNRLRG